MAGNSDHAHAEPPTRSTASPASTTTIQRFTMAMLCATVISGALTLLGFLESLDTLRRFGLACLGTLPLAMITFRILYTLLRPRASPNTSQPTFVVLFCVFTAGLFPSIGVSVTGYFADSSLLHSAGLAFIAALVGGDLLLILATILESRDIIPE